MGKITDLLRGHRLVALDSCIWIYHLEGNADYCEYTTEIMGAISQGRCRAVISELSLMEVIVGPLKLARQDVADEYETLLSHFPNLEIVQITRAVLLKAAELRVKHRLRTPDAIILATATVSGASLVIGNDENWLRVQDQRVACLSALLSK